jgi:hypothetical protein
MFISNHFKFLFKNSPYFDLGTNLGVRMPNVTQLLKMAGWIVDFIVIPKGTLLPLGF